MRATVCAAFACLALTACGRGDHRRGWDWERMRVQPRYDIYGPSASFADSMAMQQPPAGTVAREAIVDAPELATGQTNGQYVTTIPVPVTDTLLSLGRSRFAIYCAVCHGDGGYGGSIVATNMLPPRPPSLRAAAMRALPPGFVFHVITNGFGRMPSYAAELSAQERWAVIAYLQQLQRSERASTSAQREDSLRAARLQPAAMDSLARRATFGPPSNGAIRR